MRARFARASFVMLVACAISAPTFADVKPAPKKGGAACTPTNGGVEICDGIDNDCDGYIDMPFTSTYTGNTPNYDKDVAHCGACDAACNLPNAKNGCHRDTAADASAKGVCFVASCKDGFSYVPSACGTTTPSRDGPTGVGCNYACPVWPIAVEVCDGKDNDCNGQVDELRDADACSQNGLIKPPGTTCAKVGVCAGQTIEMVCKGEAGWRCDYRKLKDQLEAKGISLDLDARYQLAVKEKHCGDNLDNNCNGTIDDGCP